MTNVARATSCPVLPTRLAVDKQNNCKYYDYINNFMEKVDVKIFDKVKNNLTNIIM